MIDLGGADHAVNHVAIVNGSRQPLEQNHAHALAGHETITTLTEALATTVRRQHPRTTQLDVVAGMQVQVDAACEGELAFLAQQVLARLVYRGERCRAHGIDWHARAVQVEEIRDAIGQGAE